MKVEDLARELFEMARLESGGRYGWDYQAQETKDSFTKVAQSLLERYDIEPKGETR